MPADTTHTEEKGDLVIKALRSGRRPGSAAQLINVDRSTLYRWRNEHEDFAARWDEATAIATDRIEEVLYSLALKGDLGACAYWLKHRRPERFDRATWIKLAVLKAALTKASANGRNRVEIRIGPDGMPVAVDADPEDDDQVRIYLPDNGRQAIPRDQFSPDPALRNGEALAEEEARRAAARKKRAEVATRPQTSDDEPDGDVD